MGEFKPPMPGTRAAKTISGNVARAKRVDTSAKGVKSVKGEHGTDSMVYRKGKDSAPPAGWPTNDEAKMMDMKLETNGLSYSRNSSIDPKYQAQAAPDPFSSQGRNNQKPSYSQLPRGGKIKSTLKGGNNAGRGDSPYGY